MENANAENNAARRRCARCGVRFVDGPPPPKAVLRDHEAGDGPPPPKAVLRRCEAGDVEWLRCPDCGLRFWADPAGGKGGRCAVGLCPEDAP